MVMSPCSMALEERLYDELGKQIEKFVGNSNRQGAFHHIRNYGG